MSSPRSSGLDDAVDQSAKCRRMRAVRQPTGSVAGAKSARARLRSLPIPNTGMVERQSGRISEPLTWAGSAGSESYLPRGPTGERANEVMRPRGRIKVGVFRRLSVRALPAEDDDRRELDEAGLGDTEKPETSNEFIWASFLRSCSHHGGDFGATRLSPESRSGTGSRRPVSRTGPGRRRARGRGCRRRRLGGHG